jgi:hypothetical protein
MEDGEKGRKMSHHDYDGLDFLLWVATYIHSKENSGLLKVC